MEAIINNKKDIVKLLITSGANVNAIDINKWTPLHFAVQEAGLTNDLDICINAQESYGNTSLLNAVYYQNEKLQKFLLDNGADENIKNHYGVSAKSFAESIDT